MGKSKEKNALGARMKTYEAAYRRALEPGQYTIIRVDGKAFHNVTSKLERPYDAAFMTVMDLTMVRTAKEMQNMVLAYVQSDEISFLLYNPSKAHPDQWMGGVLDKMVSISAGYATAYFNAAWYRCYDQVSCAVFDSRVYTIPNANEVINYFVWRHNDCTRNSVAMMAQQQFSRNDLHGVDVGEQKKMLVKAGEPWEDEPDRFRFGQFFYYGTEHKKVKFFHKARQRYEETPEPVPHKVTRLESWTQDVLKKKVAEIITEQERVRSAAG